MSALTFAPTAPRCTPCPGKNLSFSAVGDATNWTTGTGAGFINLSTQDRGRRATGHLEIYYDKLSIFSSRRRKIWSVGSGPAAERPESGAARRGHDLAAGPLQYGSGDVLYLNQTGIRSIRARDASNSGAVTDMARRSISRSRTSTRRAALAFARRRRSWSRSSAGSG